MDVPSDTSDSLKDLAQAVSEHDAYPRNPQLIPASLGLRLGAAALDLICFPLCLIPVACPLMGLLLGLLDSFGPAGAAREDWAFTLMVLVAGCVYRGTDALFGRTIGRVWVGLRIIADGEGLSLHARLVIRWVLQMIPCYLCIVVASAVFANSGRASFMLGKMALLSSTSVMLAPLIICTVLASIPFGRDQKPWYDCVARTIVVQRSARPKMRGFEPILSESSLRR